MATLASIRERAMARKLKVSEQANELGVRYLTVNDGRCDMQWKESCGTTWLVKAYDASDIMLDYLTDANAERIKVARMLGVIAQVAAMQWAQRRQASPSVAKKEHSVVPQYPCRKCGKSNGFVMHMPPRFDDTSKMPLVCCIVCECPLPYELKETT